MLIFHLFFRLYLCTGQYHVDIGQMESKPECKSPSHKMLAKNTNISIIMNTFSCSLYSLCYCPN